MSAGDAQRVTAAFIRLRLAATRSPLGLFLGGFAGNGRRQDRRVDFSTCIGFLRSRFRPGLAGARCRFDRLFRGIIPITVLVAAAIGAIIVAAIVVILIPVTIRAGIAAIIVMVVATIAAPIVVSTTIIAIIATLAAVATGPARIFAVIVSITIVVRLTTLVVAITVTLRALFVLTGLVVGDHAEIMVRKLQIIFLLHTVAMMVGVLRKLLVLIEQLRRITARAAINAVHRIRIATALIAAVVTTTTTVIVITLIVQGILFLIIGRYRSGRTRKAPCRARLNGLETRPYI